jgi:hypothetical protein
VRISPARAAEEASVLMRLNDNEGMGGRCKIEKRVDGYRMMVDG